MLLNQGRFRVLEPVNRPASQAPIQAAWRSFCMTNCQPRTPEVEEKRSLYIEWRVSLRDCVDAAPVVIVQFDTRSENSGSSLGLKHINKRLVHPDL